MLTGPWSLPRLTTDDPAMLTGPWSLPRLRPQTRSARSPSFAQPLGRRARGRAFPGRRLRSLSLGLLLLAGLAAPAWARSERTLAYQRADAWPAAVRFLVVDEHLKITDRDAEAGYVLFELRDDGKLFRGSLEVMTVVRDGRTLVRFVLQIADRPSWLEIAMLTRLETKLRAELGSPAPPPSRQDPPPAKDEPKPDAPRPDAPRPDAPKLDAPKLDAVP